MASGLQRLMVQGLERTPYADLIMLTAQTWVEAMEHGRVWDEARDAARIRAGFLVLIAECEKWPQVRHLLAAIPPPAEQPRLERKWEAVPLHPKTQAMVDGLAKELGLKKSPSKSTRQ